jgi:hypothetical protein
MYVVQPEDVIPGRCGGPPEVVKLSWEIHNYFNLSHAPGVATIKPFVKHQNQPTKK